MSARTSVTTIDFYALNTPAPSDPELAAMDMALAYHLLRDKQIARVQRKHGLTPI